MKDFIRRKVNKRKDGENGSERPFKGVRDKTLSRLVEVKPWRISWLPLPVSIAVLAAAVLGSIGIVGALNGWFGGGGDIPSDTMTRGLVGYWNFDEASGAMVYDASDNGNHGTLENDPEWSFGKVGSAVSFDGTDDYVDFGDLGQAEFNSISLWFKSTDMDDTTYGHALITKRDDGTETKGEFDLMLDQGVPKIDLYSANGDRVIASAGSNYADGEWHYATVITDSSHLKIYIDGDLKDTVATSDGNTNFGGEANSLILARGFHSGSMYYVDCVIDEVRIYDRALSAEEVRYHYNRGAPVAHWKFDEGTGSTAYDSTENDNDGTLYGEMATSTDSGSGWTAGKHGSALAFDDVDDYVKVSHDSSLNCPNVLSVSAWFKTGDDARMNILSKHYNDYGVAMQASDRTLRVWYGDGSSHSDPTITIEQRLDDNEWHHYATVIDKENGRADWWIDGEYVGYDTDEPKTGNREDTLYIGTRFPDSQRWDGILDDVRIYNYARTPEEIRLDYNAGFAARFGPLSSCDDDPGACMTEGLVGYWSMEESGGAKAYDASGNDNHGTIKNNPEWSFGKVGSALSFDGVDDYVDLGNLGEIGEEFSFECWFKTISGQGYNMFVNVDGEALGNPQLRTSYGKVQFRFYGGNSLISADSYNDGQWHHAVGGIDSNGDYFLYVNGQSQGTLTPDDALNWTGNTRIALYSYSSGYYYNGLLDEVRIYNRALSAEEVRYHYNRGAPVAHWKFDEGTGSTAYDSTENDNDGTLYGEMATSTDSSSGWTAGKHGSALAFDGTDDYVNIGDKSDFDGLSEVTLAAWIKYNTNPDDFNGMVIWKGNHNLFLYSRTVSDEFQFTVGNGTNYTTPSIPFVDIDWSIWNHIVGTYDGTSAKIYLNGVLKDTHTDFNGDVVTSGYDLNIGARAESDLSFNGFIDDVRIYNYARTEEQIMQDYNAGLSMHFK